MKLAGNQKAAVALALAAGAFALLLAWLNSRKASSPLLTAERIGPTYNNDERASEVLAYVNTEFATVDAKERLTGYQTAALAVRPPSRLSALAGGGINPTDQFRFERELEAAYRNSGAYRDLDFQTFASYARGTSTSTAASSPFAGFFGKLGFNTN